MFTKRLHIQNDTIASEKQITYVSDLLNQAKKFINENKVMQQEAQSGDEYYTAVIAFWNAAQVPADLTKWEASALIDLLKSFNASLLVERFIDAAERGGKYSDRDSVMALTAFQASVSDLAARMEA